MTDRVADRPTLFVIWCRLYKVRCWDSTEEENIVPWTLIEKVLDELNDEALTKERTDDTVPSRVPE